MNTVIKSVVLLLFVFGALRAVPAAAQDQTPASQNPPPAQQGPLVLQPIHNGFVITPDVKVTRMDNATRTLVGAYGGWLLEDTLLLGGGGYWLADRGRNEGMAYGGFVVGWTVAATDRIRFGARGLVGGGQATVAQDVTFTVPFGRDFFRDQGDTTAQTTTFARRARFHQGFFIAEPQAELVLRVTGWMAVDVGAGYRAVAAARGLDQQLRGPVGSLGLRFGL